MLKNSVKRLLLFYILNSAFLITQAQVNLVPNPSFEIHDTCPNAVSTPGNFQLRHAKPWFEPTQGSPDLFDACAPASTFANVPNTIMGFSYAHTGNAMSGLILMDGDGFCGSCSIYREYIMVNLLSPLVANQKYYLTYYVKLADSSRYASDNICVFFGDTIFKSTSDTILVSPQVKSVSGNFFTNKASWTKISASFSASGGESFMCLGNFTHPIANDTLFLGGDRSYTGMNIPYYYVDDICLSSDSLYSDTLFVSVKSTESDEFSFYPNPTNSHLYLINSDSRFDIEIYTIDGVKMFAAKNELSIDVSKLQTGIYLLRYITKENNIFVYKLFKD